MTQPPPLVLLFGGIGNRLFQLARACDLHQRGQRPLVADIEEFHGLHWAVMKLLGWTQHPMWIDTAALCDTLGLQRAKPDLRLRAQLNASLIGLALGGRRAHFNAPLSTDRRSVQIGYFQTLDAISRNSVFAVADAVHDLLDPVGLAAAQAVMHVRGGDFAVKDRLSADMVADFVAANPDCICVTNDAEYVLSHYPDVTAPPSTGPKADFGTLSAARIILPSNSTFCFWASTIAVRRHGAKLWFRPADEYWGQLDGCWIH